MTLFGFPIGRIKSETIFPIGIAHWSKWPNQIFPKKIFFFFKNLPLVPQGRFFSGKDPFEGPKDNF